MTGQWAGEEICSALDKTHTTLERLTNNTESEALNLQSIALPVNEKSLGYVQVILRHNFSSSKVADLVSNLQSMQFEIQACPDNLESTFKHVQDLYNFTNNHCKQRVNTCRRYTPCTGHTPVPPWLGYEDKHSWGSSGYGQPPNGVLPCVGEVPGQCTTPGYNTYTGHTQTHHLTYTDRATQPGYVMYTFGVAPRVQSLHGNPFPLSYTNHGP